VVNAAAAAGAAAAVTDVCLAGVVGYRPAVDADVVDEESAVGALAAAATGAAAEVVFALLSVLSSSCQSVDKVQKLERADFHVHICTHVLMYSDQCDRKCSGKATKIYLRYILKYI
jgi:hypothetical protein